MLACMLAMKCPAVKVDLKLLVANTKLSIAFPIIDVIGYCVAFKYSVLNLTPYCDIQN